MKRRTSRTEYLFLVVAIRKTDISEGPSSSSFPAAPAVNDKPGLAKSQATSGEIFPWAKAGSK